LKLSLASSFNSCILDAAIQECVGSRDVRFALQTDFALRTLLYLATTPGRSTVSAVADFYGISTHHLGKVVHQLGRLGFVRNVRGPRGGIELERSASAITVGAVVRAFEGRNVHLLDCVDTPGVCVIQPGCRLRGVLARAEQLQMEYLDGVTLADLVPPGSDLVSLTVATPSNRAISSESETQREGR
jgi:Rrf2 family transcriptional regulator, nitric oxide-sensitive transcriptional repressor